MHTATYSPRRPPPSGDIISSDFMALAAHLNTCNRSRGRWFGLRATLELMHSHACARLVTTGTLVALSGLFILAVA